MSPAPPSAVRTAKTFALCALAAVGLVLGGWRAQALLAAPPDPTSLTVGDVTFQVTEAQEVTGLSDADLGGMSHGVQSLVSADKALIRVVVTVTAGDRDTDYDATALIAGVAGARSGTAPVAGSLPVRGRLVARSHLEGSLSYVVARNGARLVLSTGPGTRQVPLLYVSVPGATGGDSHGGSHGASHTDPAPPASPSIGPPSGLGPPADSTSSSTP